MPELDVHCAPTGDGWACTVTVGGGSGETSHEVSVVRSTLAKLDPRADDPEALVRASFEFLLEREPSESILRSFALPVIGRYFPEYESAIRKRLGGA